ncbi:MAG: hypothetical protein ABSF29_11870, partial [Tepidisphaeraceae bacterium]
DFPITDYFEPLNRSSWALLAGRAARSASLFASSVALSFALLAIAAASSAALLAALVRSSFAWFAARVVAGSCAGFIRSLSFNPRRRGRPSGRHLDFAIEPL